jgi:hypothetical protein
MADNGHDTRTEHELRRPDLAQPELHHEQRDVDVWAIGKFAIALILLSIVSLSALFGLYQYFLKRAGGRLQQPEKGFNVDARHRPPAPQLEETPVLDWQRELAAEEQILNSYGWIDRQNGGVRIPIGRAIDLLAQRGLPARTEAPASETAGVTVPTASGLGPKMQQVGGPLASELNGGATR